MADTKALLLQYRPVLLYDSQEAFFADHPAQMVEMPGATLRRGGPAGKVLAHADDGTLTLETLAARSYTTGDEVKPTDVLSVLGNDYRDQYVAFRRSARGQELKNHVVAHARRDPADGRLWLQYWFFSFFNDYRLAANVGLHEGDWEMVQLRLDAADRKPDYAVYAQHRKAERRPWDQVERDPANDDAAVVYVARGSHASYFEPGVYKTEVWADVCDGVRRSPPSRLLIVDDDHPPGWVFWPGHWGDTVGRNGLEDPSPVGPGPHGQWASPNGLFLKSYENAKPRHPVRGPAFTVGRRDGHLIVTYNFHRVLGRVLSITANVNSHGEPETPPKTFNRPVQKRAGTIDTGVPVDPAKTYDVSLSVELTRFGRHLPTVTVIRSLDLGDHRPARLPTTLVGIVVVSIRQWLERRFTKPSGDGP